MRLTWQLKRPALYENLHSGNYHSLCSAKKKFFAALGCVTAYNKAVGCQFLLFSVAAY